MKQLLFWIVFICLLSACRQYGNEVRINANSHIYYKSGIQQAEAKKLGDFLLHQGYFNTSDDRKVQLSKEGNRYLVKFILDEEEIKEDQENIVFAFQVWRDWIHEHVFENNPVKVILVNKSLKKIADVPSLEEDEKKASQQEDGHPSRFSVDTILTK